MYGAKGIRTLSRHGFDSTPSIASRDALRCLANLFLLDPKTRQIFVDLGFPDQAAERLKVGASGRIYELLIQP